jgi:UDPglucose 6-dehydrogenase
MFLSELKILKGKTVGLLGLAFKAQTDDLRDAPAIDIAGRLIERGVRVKAHDPVAMERARKEYPNLDIIYCESPEQVAEETDAIILVTEWPFYRELHWQNLFPRMRTPFILDGRNFLDRELLTQIGFKYLGMGR